MIVSTHTSYSIIIFHYFLCIRQEDVMMNDLAPGYAPLDEPRPHHNNKPPIGGVPLFPNLPPVSSLFMIKLKFSN